MQRNVHGRSSNSGLPQPTSKETRKVENAESNLTSSSLCLISENFCHIAHM
ncbi:unnamed product [Ostreococcus tauri]|uniref:Unnamed product n=1 Tax=Ostreococcus tauri TaxID=70448 RepID=A0A096PAH8_OSTTA|nr:unnamed product [Ostreococcus tauri]CEG01913.1 unnamed product [Ostreococcus tauri]|eukprot:XP_022841244.1 unnamed product [Ostreococcus tauri]